MYLLHSWPDSASTIIRLIVTELGVPCDVRTIDRSGGELDSPAYRALNPLGQIPAFETPDGSMFESAAILLYLCDRHGGLAPAPDDPRRGQFLKWLFFISTNIHPTIMQYYYPDRIAGPENSAAVVALARTRIASMLSILDAEADIPEAGASALGYYIAVLMRWIARDFPSTDYPNLHRTLSHLETRPAARSTARDESLGVTIFTNPD